MPLYVVHVKSPEEHKFLSWIRKQPKSETLRLHRLERELSIRRKGKVRKERKPIFPGYIVVDTPELTAEQRLLIRHAPAFLNFLKSNQDVKPLTSDDERLVRRLIAFGDVAKASRITFDENQRIKVLEGPLEGLEGQIRKVDRRKSRVKVELDLYEKSFLVDLAIEDVGKA